MKISIITVCFNSEKYIRTAIESVLGQDYPNIEYIIIDGKSTDKTLEIINEYRDKIQCIISEPDKGIYDAMNKGLKLATGDVLATLNSDDIYTSSNVISLIVDTFKKNECDIVFGDLYYVKPENTDIIVRKWVAKPYFPDSFKKGWHPPHPTFFVKNEIFLKYGYFDLSLKLAADFELMLRFLEKYRIMSIYICKTLVKMRLGGASNKSIRNIIKQNMECYKAFKYNNIKMSPLYSFYRLFPKILQYF
jgi:glycosyltransferase involved in cell wall biosynthesis